MYLNNIPVSYTSVHKHFEMLLNGKFEVLLNFPLREDSEIIRKIMLVIISFTITNFELKKEI